MAMAVGIAVQGCVPCVALLQNVDTSPSPALNRMSVQCWQLPSASNPAQARLQKVKPNGVRTKMAGSVELARQHFSGLTVKQVQVSRLSPNHLIGKVTAAALGAAVPEDGRALERNVVANAAEDAAPVEVAGEIAAAPAAPLDPVAALKLESELLKKKAKRAELRRKRLVRKRHLRKKGRWPPSKMKKLKNV